MTLRKALAVVLAAAQVSACAHVSEREAATVRLDSVPEQRLAPMFRSESVGSLKVRSIVYKPSVLPMGGFLKKLSEGRFKSAFRLARLKYAPSNVSDEGIRTLIRHRFIPVLVDVANDGAEPADAGGLVLTLSDSTQTLLPVPNPELPNAFKDFNGGAAAANVYNTGAAVVGAAAFLGVVAACVYAQLKEGSQGEGLQLPEFPKRWVEALDGDVYNALHKTTTVDYAGLLWTPGPIAPGRSSRGLLFFKAGRPDWGELQLSAGTKGP